MRKQDELRQEIKIMKAKGDIANYKELMEYLEDCSYKGFINWLHGYYDYGEEKQKRLEELIDTLSS